MKSPLIILIVLIFSTTSAYSAMNCKDVKKTSPKYLLCKAGSSVSSFKNKLSKKRESKKETKNKSGKKSIFKKFQDAKTLKEFEGDLK